MNFKVEENCEAQSRLARIQWTNSHLEQDILSTPVCLLYTQSGSVPHLTKDVLQKVTADKHPTLLPLPSVFGFKDALEDFKEGLGKYVAMGDHPLYICCQDPAVLTPTGFNSKTRMSVWNHSGKASIDVNTFASFLEFCKPQWYQALSDGDTPKGCSKKRVSNSVRYSLELLDKCIERHSQSKVLSSACIFGSVQGGYDIKARQFSAKHTASRQVDGFIIEGFHSFGPETQTVQFSDVREMVDEVIKFLPGDKPRIIHGVYNPLFILEAIESGIDVFDASFPYVTTEKGCALVFPFNDKNDERRLEISLKDEIYKEDFSPILETCVCYTCTNFKKAYINHLLVTSEMLAPVLLMIHNLHHFLEFFKAIRESLKNKQLCKLKSLLKCFKTVEKV